MKNIQSTLLYQWFQQVWNENKKESIDSMLASDGYMHGLAEGEIKGAAGFKFFYDGFTQQFHNIQVTVQHVMQEDDMECAYCTAQLTHIETGQTVTITGMTMAKIKDGQITEAWNCYDFYNMYLQLGYTLHK
jgi:predicted SnoaL-like aldol condensation-catalyzing enzyme